MGWIERCEDIPDGYEFLDPSNKFIGHGTEPPLLLETNTLSHKRLAQNLAKNVYLLDISDRQSLLLFRSQFCERCLPRVPVMREMLDIYQ